LTHKNPEVAALARAALGAAEHGPRTPIQTTLDQVARLSGNPRNGDTLFGRHCAACHRLGGRGHAVGPDLSATQFADATSLLSQVLDPNRFVRPNYVQYTLSDRSGRVYDGLIASETATSVTLRRAEGAEDTILRSQIDELASTGKSLMPEDVAAKLSTQDMADLAAYIRSVRVTTPTVERLDIGTLPGLIEPDR
jgi:putative heme-binding domain-containing protein